MDPQKELELINEIRRGLKLDPMTMEQYHAAVSADTKEGRRHRASQEAGRRYQARSRLQKKYSLPEGTKEHPFTRCYGNLLREENTESDIEYNRKMMEKLSTPEGTTDVLDETLKQIINLPDCVYFPKDEAEMISNYEKYGALMDTMFNMKNLTDNMGKNGMTFSPAVKDFVENHKGVFDLCGMQASLVNEWASSFYPGIGDPTMENMSNIMKAVDIGKQGVSPERDALRGYVTRLQSAVMYDMEEKAVLEGGRKLIDAGHELKYAAGDIYKAASRAKGSKGSVRLETQNDKARKKFDSQLGRKIALTSDEREIMWNKNTPETPDMVRQETDELGELKKGMEAARFNVFFGSKEFDKVADDIAALQEANGKLLKGAPKELGSRQVDIMKKAYAKLEKDCRAYLERKQKQGQLDADPESKTGKRIKMVRDALKYGQLAGYRFEAREGQIKDEQGRAEKEGLQAQADEMLYNSFNDSTPEHTGKFINKLVEAAGSNSDREYGQRITDQLSVAARFMHDKGLKPADCGLNNDEFKKMRDVIKAKGVGKKPERSKEAGKTSANEMKTEQPARPVTK